jgi:hypothetical protein
MVSNRLRTMVGVLLLTVFVGQSGIGDDRGPTGYEDIIRRILRSGGFSGTLAYTGCSFKDHQPPNLPPLRTLDESGTPTEILTKLFAADPLMQVTQEEGMIRMMETSVPTDLLSLKIHRLSFYPSGAEVYGPRMALVAILRNPEVMAFRKARNIGGWDGGSLPGDCCGGGRVVHGELEDVTVSEALDHILKTFPGFWLYEDCVTKEGVRSVYINFH